MINAKDLNNSDPFFEPEMTPLHRSKRMPDNLPEEVWKGMTEQQREQWKQWKRWYADQLDEERRLDERHRRGY